MQAQLDHGDEYAELSAVVEKGLLTYDTKDSWEKEINLKPTARGAVGLKGEEINNVFQ